MSREEVDLIPALNLGANAGAKAPAEAKMALTQMNFILN
jgi:hypothetical protein